MKKILLVEDDPLLIDVYTTKLKEAGFEIILVEDGRSVKEVFEGTKPDLVLLDIVLPHRDGWEVLGELKKEYGDKVKIVVLSNLGQKEEVEKGLKLGAIRYLIKAHYTPSEVVEQIQEVLAADRAS